MPPRITSRPFPLAILNHPGLSEAGWFRSVVSSRGRRRHIALPKEGEERHRAKTQGLAGPKPVRIRQKASSCGFEEHGVEELDAWLVVVWTSRCRLSCRVVQNSVIG